MSVQFFDQYNRYDNLLKQQNECKKEILQGNNHPGGPILGMSDWVGEEVLIRMKDKESQTGIAAAIRDQSAQKMRTFSGGATRNIDTNQPDYEGFLSPLVQSRFAQYMHKHRFQSDGTIRDSDNWQKGIPLSSYMKSGYRHFMDWWLEHRGFKSREGLEEALCALLFNIQGYLHETLKRKLEQEKSPQPQQTLLRFGDLVGNGLLHSGVSSAECMMPLKGNAGTVCDPDSNHT